MKRCRGICAAALSLGFLLGIHDGRVALWKGEDPQPVRIYPKSAAVLPPEDRAALEKGIHLPDEAAAVRAAEDFCF